MAARRTKTAARAPKKKTVARKVKPAAAKRKAIKATPKTASRAAAALDLSALPAEAVIKADKWICLACVLDVFTRLMGLAPKTAHLEIKRYTPPVAELYAPAMTRPYF